MTTTSRQVRLANCIIAGVTKGGTTSLFRYLSDHPQVCGSNVKETMFFNRDYTGDEESDRRAYGKYFRHCDDSRPVRLEATPSYLVGPRVPDRIDTLVPDSRLLFILRDPAARLYSYYNFQKGQLALPEDLEFERYIDLCSDHDNDTLDERDLPFDARLLRGLRIGRYGSHLERYYSKFDRRRIKVVFFEFLRSDPRAVLTDICDFLGIDGGFFDDYDFTRVNATFSARHKRLHALSMHANRLMEPLLRQRPGLKTQLVKVYKRLNLAKTGYQPMSEQTRERLRAYFAPDNRRLVELLPGQPLPDWVPRD